MCATRTCLPPHNQSLPPSCPPHFLNPGAATGRYMLWDSVGWVWLCGAAGGKRRDMSYTAQTQSIGIDHKFTYIHQTISNVYAGGLLAQSKWTANFNFHTLNKSG